IAGPPREQRAVREQAAKLGDIDLDDLRGGRRPVLAPELLDEPVGGDDLVRVQEEDGQERALLASAEPERSVLLDDLQRAEYPKLHCPALNLTRSFTAVNPA